MMQESFEMMWNITLIWFLALIVLGLALAPLINFVFFQRRKDDGDG